MGRGKLAIAASLTIYFNKIRVKCGGNIIYERPVFSSSSIIIIVHENFENKIKSRREGTIFGDGDRDLKRVPDVFYDRQ